MDLTEDDVIFRDQISKRDQYKILATKLAMLKQALLAEKESDEKTAKQLQNSVNRLDKVKVEMVKKDEKNQTLQSEIKNLKQQILSQRNSKRKLREQLSSLLPQQPNNDNYKTQQSDKSRKYNS